MLTPKERAQADHFADRLADLYKERDAALDDGDLTRVHELQTQITEAAERRQDLLASAGGAEASAPQRKIAHSIK
jgi:hypothetical protein